MGLHGGWRIQDVVRPREDLPAELALEFVFGVSYEAIVRAAARHGGIRKRDVLDYGWTIYDALVEVLRGNASFAEITARLPVPGEYAGASERDRNSGGRDEPWTAPARVAAAKSTPRPRKEKSRPGFVYWALIPALTLLVGITAHLLITAWGAGQLLLGGVAAVLLAPLHVILVEAIAENWEVQDVYVWRRGSWPFARRFFAAVLFLAPVEGKLVPHPDRFGEREVWPPLRKQWGLTTAVRPRFFTWHFYGMNSLLASCLMEDLLSPAAGLISRYGITVRGAVKLVTDGPVFDVRRHFAKAVAGQARSP